MAETYASPRFGAPREPKNPVNPGNRLVRMIDFVTASHARAIAFLLVCGALFFLPGFFSIPPVDRDEARFAQATKQMVETGDFVDIRFQDDVRYKKPVGIYWMQAAAVETLKALGLPKAEVRIWIYRIPSLIGAIGAVLLTYWAALAFVTRRGAVLSALMMCSCVLLSAEARLAKTDAMLLLTVVAAMGALARVYLSWQRGEDPERPPWSWPIIFWTALAAGILIKGPLILMFAGLTILMLGILDRNASWLWRLRPVWGLMWMLILVLPWFIAIYWRAGGTFFTNSVGGDMLSKLASPGVAWCAARALSAAVLDHLLARRATGRHGSARDLAGAARARRAISFGLAGAVLDRVRTGADQAAALRASALSGDCDPHRRCAGAAGAVTLLAREGRGLVVRHSRAGRDPRCGRRHHADAAAGVPGLAAARGRDDPRPVCLVAL